MPNPIPSSDSWHSFPPDVQRALALVCDPGTRYAMRLACQSMRRAVELDCMEVLVSNHAVLTDIIGDQRYHAVQKLRIFGDVLQHVALLHQIPARIHSLAIYGCPSGSWIVPPTVKSLSHYPCFNTVCKHTQTDQQTRSGLTGNVQNLHLVKRPINREIIDLLASYPNIEGLSLLAADVSDNDTPSIRKMPALRALSLDSNPIGVQGVQVLLRNTHLTRLSLSNIVGLRNAKTNYKTMELLANHRSLTNVTLNYDGLVSADAQTLSKSTTIRYLTLQRNKIDGEGAAALTSNTRLETLDLDGNPIVGMPLSRDVVETPLDCLGIPDWSKDNAGIIAVTQKCKSLQRLRIEVGNLTANCLNHLAPSSISEIKITGFRLGSAVVENLARLKDTVRIDYIVDTTLPFFISSSRKFAILSMARNYHRIECLSLYGKEITDQHLGALPAALTKLEIVVCPNVSVDGMAHLVARSLTSLGLYKAVDDLAIVKLTAGKMPGNLWILDGHIGPDGASALTQCKNLTVLRIGSKSMTEPVFQALLTATHRMQVYINRHKLVGLEANGIVAELVPIERQKRKHGVAFPKEENIGYANSSSEIKHYSLDFADALKGDLYGRTVFGTEKLEETEITLKHHWDYEKLRQSTNYAAVRNLVFVGDDFHAGHILQLPCMLRELTLRGCNNVSSDIWAILPSFQIASLTLVNVDIESHKFCQFIDNAAGHGPTSDRRALTHLSLKHIAIGNNIALSIARNAHVASLSLEGVPLHPVVAGTLATSKTLTELSLTNVSFDMNSVVALSNISTLSKLTVAGTDISPKYVQHFSRMPSLTSFIYNGIPQQLQQLQPFALELG